MKKLKSLVLLLLVVGGLNWGLVGLFDMNLVTMLFGEGSMGAKVVYALVGVAAVLKVICWLSGPCRSGSCHSGKCER